MAKKNQCEWYDYIDDKPSKLHKELIGKQGRPQGNLLYAAYKTSDIADKMDAVTGTDGRPLYRRNSQGQHNAADVLRFLDWYNVSSEKLDAAERAVGAKDDSNNIINYTDATKALQNAKDFNETRQHLVANVYKHGDVYNIVVSERNSRTVRQSDEVKEKLELWDYYKSYLAANGIDITTAPDGIKDRFSAFESKLVETLQNIKRSEFKYMNKEDALMTFFLNASSPQVQRLVGSFGSIEAAAQAVYDINKGTASLASGQETLLRRAIDYGKDFPTLDLDAMQREASRISSDIKSKSPSEAIAQEIHRLNKKYHIDFNESHKTSNNIDSLSGAATEAVLNLERQIREIEREEGKNDEGRRLTIIKEQLLKELANKKYYSGILNYLQEASRQLNYDPDSDSSVIDTILQEAGEATGTDLEKAMIMAKAQQRILDLKNKYYPLVSALANDNLKIDESIDQDDIDNIRNSAKALKNLFDKQKNKLEEAAFDTMEDLMTEIVGNETPDGISMHNALRMAAVDSSAFDYLYSMGRASNPIIGAMGDIVRKAQQERDAYMNDWALRTRRVTHKLYKSGSNSEFMYEDEGHIASPYDWEAFEKAKKEEAKKLRKLKLDTWEFKQALEDWVNVNTEEVVVDTKSGRTERVPDSKFRKTYDFQEGWTDAQKEYYREMMQIKGEIGTLLPAYAQRQFLPPQVRRSTLDALGHAKSARDIIKAVRNKLQNIVKVREDDTEFARNGVIVDGQEMLVTQSDFDNTKLRHIPIFNINRVEEGELMKDFSGALSHLAGTAVNYHVMNNVIDVVEFMGDFAINQSARSNEAEADVVGNRFFRVVSDVFKKGRNRNTENLINGFIAQHFYGQRLDPNQKGYKLAKPILSLINYTSFKGLATNVKGAFSNYLVGEWQMMVESGCGEFYTFKNFLRAHTRLFGGSGVGGEIAELLTNNVNHKGVLLREKFDPQNDNFSDKSNMRYYKNAFRQLVGHDCAFIGYASGEYLIHYVNMYSIMDHEKLLLNGKKITVYDAYEVVNKKDGNSELKLKDGVTTLDGEAVTPEWEQRLRGRIRYCNQSCHGSMNTEDKGIIHQKLWGRGVMNFRQWMVEHYSRRFRKAHFDESLGENREGYWTSFWKMYRSDELANSIEDKEVMKSIGLFMRDFATFVFRAQSQWSNLTEHQKYNVKRVMSEMTMYIALLGLSFALGEPEDHKREFWRRWWIYQVKRLILDTEASMPNSKIVQNGLTIIQSPMAGISTLNSLLYIFYGIDDIDETLKSGPHKGENKYWRTVKKNALPFFKDYEQLMEMDTSDAVFLPFKNSPNSRY